MHVTWCTRFESLVWLSLLGLAFATTQTIIERLIFYWGERIADPVELSLCLTRWRKTRRPTGLLPDRLGWLKPLVQASGTPRALLSRLHSLQAGLRRASVLLPRLGNLGVNLGLIGTVLALFGGAESANRLSVLASGLGTTGLGLGIYSVAGLLDGLIRSRALLFLPQVKEVAAVVTELIQDEPPTARHGISIS